MSTRTLSLTRRPAWKALAAHHKKIQGRTLRRLFADDPQRAKRLSLEAVGLFLDYSKNRIASGTMPLLLKLARESGLRGRIDAMFSGEKINLTENRAVLHVALRAPRGVVLRVDGKNVVPDVHAVLAKMEAFAQRIRRGTWKGHTGKRIRHIVNIGIGGSDLGPVMAYEALKHYSQRGLDFRFVSNVDGADFVEAVRDLEASLLDLHQVFLDMAVLVEAQGEMLDSIEAQVARAKDHVESGVSHLVEAKRMQKRTRRLMCCALVTLLVIVAVIVLAILKPWQIRGGGQSG